ncbi:hypothetical protein ACPUYX_03770 [Desulfosporosinus sp. SYSU MS00001]|uniref:hypothetical protein n=1 Tax=Desulfosporosinus sp. SYSU MS00001 TaxID=3416284 RepID=UPI003CEA4DC1
MCLNKITFWGLINIFILALSSGVIMTTQVTSQIPYYQICTVHQHGAEGKFLAFAHALGIDANTLSQELNSGKTLAQIAYAKGIDTKTLSQRLQTDFDNHINKAIISGKITTDKASQIKAQKAIEIVQEIERPRTSKVDKILLKGKLN